MASFRQEQEKWEQDVLSAKAKRSASAKRWKSENPDPLRTEYQRDTGRILYSDAFRRLRMKTQVFPANGMRQHERTRLTHSYEVSQIARSIARPLRLNVDLTEAIALGHDLGHTPFGHAGEAALNKALGSKGTFNHNAQSVWILTRHLYHRTDQHGNKIPGLNLTFDVLEGIWKHTDYSKSLDEFDLLRYLNPDKPASLECQTVDMADGIAYLIHDLDDGVRNELIAWDQVEELWNDNSSTEFNNQTWTTEMIYDVINSSEGRDEVQFSPEMAKLYDMLKAFVREKVIKSELVARADARGKEIVQDIFDFYVERPELLVGKHVQNEYMIKKYGVERVVVDYIQWFGDETAIREHEKVSAKCK